MTSRASLTVTQPRRSRGAAQTASKDGGRPFSSVARLSGPLSTEELDTYSRVIAVLNPRWRVIVCRQSTQWVLQKRGGANHWRGVWFCCTRAALLRGTRQQAGQIAGDALVTLLRLPERFPEGAP